MKLLTALLLLCFSLTSCGNNPYKGVPEPYHKLLDEAFAKAGDNRAEMERALAETPRDQREGMAFLIAYMPEYDLTTLKADYLLKNVSLAYEARNRFAWAKSVPDDVFLNDVLPYANANETRDDWREDFYNRFAPHVENCATLEEAIYAVNANAHPDLKVEYNTARRRADQSPAESLEISIASCTGLSILLTDAFRSVGIPSRLAGTIWSDNRGNHTWSEVWLDGKWYFTEYYFEDLDKAWFLSSAGKAIPGDPKHGIYAATYKPAGEPLSLPWYSRPESVSAQEVTQGYLDIYNEVYADRLASGDYTILRVKMFKANGNVNKSDDRIQVNVDVFRNEDGLQIGGGSTSGPTRDMNDVLEFMVEKGKEYTVKYFPDGREEVRIVGIGDKPKDLVLFENTVVIY